MSVASIAGLALLLALPGAPASAAPAMSGGTGFFLGGAGHLVTAAHVVANCGSITVVPEGATALAAEVASADPVLDLAVLRVAGVVFPAPELAGAVAAGDVLLALGYPGAAQGGRLHAHSLTAIELPIPRPPARMPLRGAVAAPGMSGAPLVDARGRVAGMLLGRGDPAVGAALAREIGYPLDQIAIAMPAVMLAGLDHPAVRPGAGGPVAVARILCNPG